jgi:hypothetical protein
MQRDPVLVDLALQGGGAHGAFTWSNATLRTRDGDGVQARAGLNQRAERAQSD